MQARVLGDVGSLQDVSNLLQRVPPLTEQHGVRPHPRALGRGRFHQRAQLRALCGREGLHKFRRRFHTHYYTAEFMPTCLHAGVRKAVAVLCPVGGHGLVC